MGSESSTRDGAPSPGAPRLKIVVLAYSISPVRGSEYSVGWNHVRHLSAHCDLTVLYGLAGSHMGDFEEIEDYLREKGEVANVRFISVRPNLFSRIANFPNRNGFMIYSFYLAYRFWHAQAARTVADLIAVEHFDVLHYLCPIGYREPGFLWKVDKPYVWGPIGGTVSSRSLVGAPRPWTARFKMYLKGLTNSVQLATSKRVERAVKRANIIIAATTENGKVIKSCFGVDPYHIPENAIPDEWLIGKELRGSNVENRAISLIWIGSLDYRKSPDLLLDAMARVRENNWHLHIVGDGPLAKNVKTMAISRGLSSNVTFHGKLQRIEVNKLLGSSDLHLVTSLGEGNPTVVWEAMAHGVPTLTLDHSGMHDVICNRCGMRVLVTTYDETCNAIAVKLEEVLKNREKLNILSDGVRICREKHLWSKRSLEWLEVYSQAIELHRQAVKNK